MIKVDYNQPKYRECSVCHSTKDVAEIHFRYEHLSGFGQGTIVSLCKECRTKLKIILEAEVE